MFKLFDRVKVNIATTGTGDVTFGSASSNAFLTPTEAGAGDGDTVRYMIVDGLDFEEGIGTIGGGVTTMARTTVAKSKIGGTAGTSKINLSGTAVLSLTASAADILIPANNLSDLDDADTALDNLGGTTVGKALFTAADAAEARGTLEISDTLPTTQVFTTGSGTYTTPAGCKWIEVELIGGGGGGSGSGTSYGNGFAAGNTTFGDLTGGGANGGANAGRGTGGSASGGYVNLTGAGGGNGSGVNSTQGGSGGASPFGGAGAGGAAGAGAGTAAAANTGSGGGGGGVNTTPNGGGGGGSGGYVKAIINSPTSTYSYSVAAGGNGGSAGTGGAAGGAGGSGIIIVTEHYGS
ncbi:per-hexamer repeat gene protein [Nitrobacter winogradskyi Nb-255]|uniref:Per-hexamer repeat gene protein n=1 Tax=Nitrobacter winogradskyi (strain ATCC 25391 / DSM 10237 / CIP 104748 / NCIMB 11846 / Nb-255) TaxID=323098 RepID=Q3SSK6_NITWN|nr:hypothetical protein [Nitrobacter winogradskyi]ABA04735.1 per-hexamer repeat gene protein [Nitrobacter winogradskyi Nb-255]